MAEAEALFMNATAAAQLALLPTNALKLCLSQLPLNISHESIHRLAKRGTPIQMSSYKHALQLYKLHNSSNSMSNDWLDLNTQQNFYGRNDNIQIYTKSNY